MSIATKNVPLKKYSLIWFATSFLISITSQSVCAFTITPSTGFFGWGQGASVRYLPRDTGIDENFIVETWLDPNSVKEIKRGGTNNFLRKLEESFPNEDGWLFLDANSDLEGRFDIQYYYACAYNKVCGGDLVNPTSGETYPRNDGGTGAGFQLRYYPGEGDPAPGNSTLHWIQRVVSVSTRGGFVDLIDIGKHHVETPFYDITGSANEIYFLDRPYRGINKYIAWDAELYLVEVKDPDNAPKTVTIYNGIQWGWKSKAKRRRNSCEVSSSNIDNSDGECVIAKKFSDSLSSGTETDNFYLDGLTPGATFYAWINNDLPSNRCNPNTYLSGYNDNGNFLGADDNSSHLGNGFASSVLGTVSNTGTINLSVNAADGGLRGEDEGNYELYVNVYDAEDFPLETDSENNNNGSIIVGGSGGGGIIVGGSGGGGVIIGNSDGGDIEDTPGRTQQNPILPSNIDSDGWQTFSNVPGCRWYDPPIANGFEFVATDNTLFTEILDFPVGEDDLFTVMVDDLILGEFSPGDRVDFVSLLGAGVSRFKITDIDYLIGDTVETYFPIQLAFDKNVGSLKMRPMVVDEETPKQKVSESNSIWGLIGLCGFGVWKIIGFRNRK